MRAYKLGILLDGENEQQIAEDYIQLFLKDKVYKMTFPLNSTKPDFEVFWKLIC